MKRHYLGVLAAVALSACSGGGAHPSATEIKGLYEQDVNAAPGHVKFVTEPVLVAGRCFAATLTEEKDADDYDLTVFVKDGKIVNVITGAHAEKFPDVVQRVAGEGCR